jgi:transposase
MMTKHSSTDKTIELLQKQLQQQQQFNQQLQELLEKEREQKQVLSIQIEKLQSQLDQLLRALYGKKSERFKQQDIEEDFQKDKSEKSALPKKNNSTGKPPSKGKNGRRRLPDFLERQIKTYDIPEVEKQCGDCCNILKCIGQETSEQLEFMPAKLYVKQHVRLKYACPCCKGNVVIAEGPSHPIDKGLAGPNLLAEVIVSKYGDHLPLYRQQQRWLRLGMDLPRSTLCDWILQSADILAPLVVVMREDLLLQKSLHSDDTPVPVLAKGKTHTGRLWVYLSGRNQSLACTVYVYTESRNQKGPKEFLKNFIGYLHADAYAGYDNLYGSGDIIELACWAHARRKFYDVAESAKGPTLANEALVFIGKLYDIERQINEMTTEERYYYRRRHSKPLLKKFKRWLNRQQEIVLPKSPISQAIAYTCNHWRAFNNFLGYGDASIDNNKAERAIKPLVIGRRNWLFAGSHRGAKSAAILYSLVETCKQNHINPSIYFADVLQRLPNHLMKNIRELLPYNWKPLNF